MYGKMQILVFGLQLIIIIICYFIHQLIFINLNVLYIHLITKKLNNAF